MGTTANVLVLCSIIWSSYGTLPPGNTSQLIDMSSLRLRPRHFLKNGVDNCRRYTQPDLRVKDDMLSVVMSSMTMDVEPNKPKLVNIRTKSVVPQRTKRLITTLDIWPKGVVIYQLDTATVPAIIQEMTANAMADYEKFTCVRFYPFNSTIHRDLNLGHTDKLTVVDDQRGCFASYVGYRRATEMAVSPCPRRITALHELGHVLGLHHEQAVENRDQYVDSRFHNVYPGKAYNFLQPTSFEGLLSAAYDQQSIMHYNNFGFSKSGYITLQPYRQDVADNRDNPWYTFKEVNMAYNCYSAEYGCTGPVPECSNDGYPGLYEGRCQCICPEGLDPNTKCTTLLPGVCGEVIHLTRSRPRRVLQTPRYPSTTKSNTICVWIVKAPPGEKVAINVADLVAPGNFTFCQSQFRVKRHLLGQIGISYCGEGFQKTIMSVDNTVALVLETGTSSTAKMRGTARLLSRADNCYRFNDRGATYNGPVNRAQDNSKCLSWTEASKCRNHPFYKYVLEGSYFGDTCRNPGGVLDQPWCFTEINGGGCTIKYCDACAYGSVFDSYDNCEILTGGSSSSPYCQTEAGQFGCRRTCNLRNPVVKSRYYCMRPGYLPGGRVSSRLLWFYPVGSSVTYTCIYNSEVTVKRFCLSDGTWTEIRTVCVAGTTVSKQCPEGFQEGPRNLCYTGISMVGDKQAAKDACQRRGASILTIKSQEESKWIKDYKIQSVFAEVVHLGAVFVDGSWVWEDTMTPVANGYVNWLGGGVNIPNEACSMVLPYYYEFSWFPAPCNETMGVICQRPKKTVTVSGRATVYTCRDSKRDCQAMLEKMPDLCSSASLYKNYCQRTCGLCGLSGLSCEVAAPSLSHQVSMLTSGSQVNPGETLEYKCVDGFAHDTGNMFRACKLDRTLTGAEPACEDVNNMVTWMNRNELQELWIGMTSGSTIVGSSPKSRVVRTGYIQTVKAYCADPGQIFFYVSSQNGNNFTVEGVNVLECDRNRVMTWEIPPSEQIRVKPGYFYGILDPAGGRMTFTVCTEHSLGGTMVYRYMDPSNLTVGYTFSGIASECLILPVNAEIRPV